LCASVAVRGPGVPQSHGEHVSVEESHLLAA
jgi:hypothetical protein